MFYPNKIDTEFGLKDMNEPEVKQINKSNSLNSVLLPSKTHFYFPKRAIDTIGEIWIGNTICKVIAMTKCIFQVL